jgi:hypothetical protein
MEFEEVFNNAPRGIDEKTTLQHTFKFTDPHECFQSFRLVCKSWKDAVETIKFDCSVPTKIFSDIAIIIQKGLPISPFFEKYLQCFKQLDVNLDDFASENGHHIISLVLNNMHKLNDVVFQSDPYVRPGSLSEVMDPFVLQMLKNSHKTLQYAYITRLSIPDICFPKLKTLEMEIGQHICLPEFKTYFPLVLKNMERLETVKLSLRDPGYNDVCEYIVKHYSKHCISASGHSADMYGLLNIVPVKILSSVFDLQESVQNFKYVSGLQYLQLEIDVDKTSQEWDENLESLDHCLNLKAFEPIWMSCENENGVETSFWQISEAKQNIWQERMSYFKARGIRIVDDGEICGIENLQMKLAKEAGVTWKFHFK